MKIFDDFARNANEFLLSAFSTCPDKRMAGIEKNFTRQLRLSAAACRLIHEKLIFLVAFESEHDVETRGESLSKFSSYASTHFSSIKC